MSATTQAGLIGSVLGRLRQICALFHDEEEEYRVLLPYIKEGFEQGDRALHIINPRNRSGHLQRLQRGGIDVRIAEQSGQLEIRSWSDAYPQGEQCNQTHMIALVDQLLSAGKQRGYRLTRVVADMDWALESSPGVNTRELVEYESRLNYILPRYADAVCCVYNLAHFGAAVVVDILRTHPLVIIGGVLQQNPFYVPPDELLKELQERQDASSIEEFG